MSARVVMNSEQLDRLGAALAQLTKAALSLNVRFDAYGPIDLVVIGAGTVHVRWDQDQKQYVVDEQVGS